ncbi:hypothetical protein B0J14DRAFT_586816 [Halenospora varia]|nr:hypothetical protein B0J14DRAFT_586816 [Halenospora varia]
MLRKLGRGSREPVGYSVFCAIGGILTEPFASPGFLKRKVSELGGFTDRLIASHGTLYSHLSPEETRGPLSGVSPCIVAQILAILFHVLPKETKKVGSERETWNKRLACIILNSDQAT